MARNSHASVVNDILRDSGETTHKCAWCGDLHLDRGRALRCCSDQFPGDEDEDPEPQRVACDGSGTRLDDYQIPTVEELEEERQRVGVSKSELSHQAGREVHAWSEIVTNDIDPRVSTMQRFLDALREARDADTCPTPGRNPGLRSDGGKSR